MPDPARMPHRVDRATRPPWFTRPVALIGGSSFLSDLGHEVPTALLPGFLTATLGTPAAAHGFFEGIAEGGAGVAKLAGGALADDPHRRRTIAIGGYTTTAVLSSAIGVATTPLQVGLLRTGAWVARGLRGPARNALLTDVTEPSAFGRAFGFERMMDNLGAIAGPLLALLLISLVGVRTAIVISIVPGLAAAVTIALAARHVRPVSRGTDRRVRLQVKRVLRGSLGRLFVGIGAFELGNAAATLMILRATELLEPTHGQDSAAQIAVTLYVAYNVAAALASLPGGTVSDSKSARHSLVIGASCFLLAYLIFAGAGAQLGILLGAFVLAGIGIGFAETAEAAAVASLSAEDVRGSAFGILAGIQSLGNLMASGIAGLLWTLVSPTLAFLWLAVWMAVACVAFAATRAARPTEREGA